jgi:predicted alpha/beta superfamily hydrolase
MNRQKTGVIRVVCTALFILLWSPHLHALPFRTEPTGREEIKQTVFSLHLKEERTIAVSLPKEYEAGSGSYPVLFVLDAESRKGWTQALSAVERLHAAGTIPQMIVVGIWNTVRNRDMIPIAVSHRPGSGGSRRFLDFLADELIPHVRHEYGAGGFGVLYGGSNAGLFSVYALLARPGTFDAYIASSPMIGHCPEFIREAAASFVRGKGIAERFLYMIYGDQDSRRVTAFVPDFQEFLESNAPAGFRSRLDILKGEGHVPESSLSRGLRYVFIREDSPHARGKRPR